MKLFIWHSIWTILIITCGVIAYHGIIIWGGRFVWMPLLLFTIEIVGGNIIQDIEDEKTFWHNMNKNYKDRM